MAHIQDRWYRKVGGRKTPTERHGVGKRWRVRYRTANGDEVSQPFDVRGDAERFVHSVEHSRSMGTFVDPRRGRELVVDRAAGWLNSVAPTLKPKTVASYESLLRSRVIPALGRRPLAGIRPSEIQTWVGEMQSQGLSASRIRQAYVVLRQVLEAAVNDGVIGRNPAVGIKLPRIMHKEAAYFEPDIVRSIADALPEPYDLLTLVLGTLGLRWGEAAALRCRHVNLMRRRILVEESLTEISGRLEFGSTKGHAVRSVPLTPSLAAALGTHMNTRTPDDLIFTAPGGGPLRHGNYLRRVWHPTLGRLGLPLVGLHTLRHSAAARLIGAGASPKALQQVLGHRSAAFSLTVYGHIFEADLDELAERMDDSPAARRRPTGVHLLASPDDA